MLCTAENDVQGRGIDDEHAKAGTGEDTGEVVRVPNDGLAEGEAELRLDSKYL